MHRLAKLGCVLAAATGFCCGTAICRTAAVGEDWLQFKFDSRHSGDVPDRSVRRPLGLIGAVPLTDAIFTSPVVAGGKVYVLDGAGVLSCVDATTLKVDWSFRSRGGPGNCNNVSSPAVIGPYVHFGTMAGSYYVLDRRTGRVVNEIRCGEPIFSAVVVSGDRAYFATLGARVYAVRPDGTVCWEWDFVREVLGFSGDRWNGQDWLKFKKERVTWRDHFVCSRNIAVYMAPVSGNERSPSGKPPTRRNARTREAAKRVIVMPAGGRVVFLEDTGDQPKVRAIALVPKYAGTEYAACFGLSIDQNGGVYVQWHRRDNAGRVEIFRLKGDQVESDFVPGTETAINRPGLLSFCSVSVRGRDVFRCRPQEGFALCKHSPDSDQPQPLGGYPSICPPILLKDVVLYGGLDGRLYAIPISGRGSAWSFATAFGKPITAPPAVCDGRVYFGCEDGYLYLLGPGGRAPLPNHDLHLERIRTPLTGPLADPKYDWYSNYGNMANTNANNQGLRPPFRIQWLRRYEGTFKHLPVCGGGRMYTHTAEGQIFAVEQTTGRLLWRRYWPGVYLSFTAPLYYHGLLLLPQGGLKGSYVRCLDAATGRLLWQAPFTGSPSWSRQAPPVVFENRVIYASGSGRYAPQGTDRAFVMKGKPKPSPDGAEIMSWIYTHNNPYYPRDNKPLIWAWDLKTGKLVWQKDFSEYGRGGNDCGLCLMDGVVYYSTFFGYSASQRRRRGLPDGPNGLTAAIDPRTGRVLWLTTDYYVTAGCTVSAKDGRLYLGGYNPPHEGTKDRFILCLDARDGSLVWRSPSVPLAVNVITVGERFVISNVSWRDWHLLDKKTGRIISRFSHGYACTRYTLSEPYAMAANMDVIDLSDGNRLVTTGPAVDSRECVGSSVSNGRLFYTSQASGLQVGLVAGELAEKQRPPWATK